MIEFRDKYIPAMYNGILEVQDKYAFFVNSNGRMYVPTTEGLYEQFIDALWEIKKGNRNKKGIYNLIRKHPYLLPRNRWDDGFHYLSTEGKAFYDMFGYHELSWLSADNSNTMKTFLSQLDEELNATNYLYKFRILDSKEKYGTLRIYVNAATLQIHEIIDKYTKILETELGFEAW